MLQDKIKKTETTIKALKKMLSIYQNECDETLFHFPMDYAKIMEYQIKALEHQLGMLKKQKVRSNTHTKHS